MFKILEGNIGYADLERLENPQVASMFDQLKGTSGIVFDMRGYPRGTAWSIAPRINTKRRRCGAVLPSSAQAAIRGRASRFFQEPLPTTDVAEYDRRTVMLIDERAIGQSEHTRPLLQGRERHDVRGQRYDRRQRRRHEHRRCPGGIRVSFTGHDVRWPDGRQLQRVGLIPDVPVTPTIAGIRAGRDEVLEAAVAFLKKQGGKT